uniref:DNA-directed DNA polymerase n=1 Tax=Wolfiporia cocos TaxID=81056 RepID=A0A7G7YDW3_9APHY|nr:hypothetical protein [Wolfiporia cocos]
MVGDIYNDIRSGYTGGATDVYIPYGENVFLYDVNSLYPTVMANCPMPVGKPVFFEGNIRNKDKNAFGFFRVKMTTPENLEHPILQTKVQTSDGLRTVAPLGQWEDVIFSPEMDNAVKLAYKFEILSGYTFDQAYIFKDYIENLYEIKQTHSKKDPMYLISKLLMNSLYGRWAMDYELNKHFITKDLEPYLLKYNIIENIDLGNGNMLLNCAPLHVNEEYYPLEANVNMAIAAAITAYARIYMSNFKNNPNIKLLYTDTDSIAVLNPLDEELIDKSIYPQYYPPPTFSVGLFFNLKKINDLVNKFD